MRGGTFVRVAIFLLPDPMMSTPDLSTLTLMCHMPGILEGWLLEDVVVGGLCVAVRQWHGRSCRRRLKSTRITQVSHHYVLTDKRLYHLLRAPAPAGETFT